MILEKGRDALLVDFREIFLGTCKFEGRAHPTWWVIRKKDQEASQEAKKRTHVMKTTSQLPSFSPASSSRSKSMTFCSSFSLACAGSSSADVTRLPASQTREKFGDVMSSRKRCRPVWPVAPSMSADFGPFFAGVSSNLTSSQSKTRKKRKRSTV